MGVLFSRSMLTDALGLSKRGILGMNRRNIDYIGRYNSRALFPLVDNKLLTKKLAMQHGVTVPALIGVVDNQHDVATIGNWLNQHQGFCIKPAKGSGGKGILVIRDFRDGEFIRANGSVISITEIQRHVSNILAGLFSLAGASDVAVVEALIKSDPALDGYSYEGVPDVRVIVFRGVPIMAMMRLACKASNGKANLHQGAIGVGISLQHGHAISAVQNDQPILFHGDTEQPLLDLKVPYWRPLLELACACADMTELGYLGVDMVLDETAGPTLLELNARPGLSIQMANNAGLLPRLRKIEALSYPERMSISERLNIIAELE